MRIEGKVPWHVIEQMTDGTAVWPVKFAVPKTIPRNVLIVIASNFEPRRVYADEFEWNPLTQNPFQTCFVVHKCLPRI